MSTPTKLGIPITLGHQANSTLTKTAAIVFPGTVFTATNEWIASPNNRRVLVFQTDGNLVLYCVADNPGPLGPGVTFHGKPIWYSQELLDKMQSNSTFEVRTDGNLGVYSKNGAPLWEIKGNGIIPAGLHLHDDGNLVLYKAEAAWWHFNFTERDANRVEALKNSTPIDIPRGAQVLHRKIGSANVVAPGTVFESKNMWLAPPNKERILIFQSDGNLVLYQVVDGAPANGSFKGKAVWDAESSKNQTQTFEVQNNGDLVVYDASRGVVWNSKTTGVTPVGLYLQDDGNVVLYKSVPAWTPRGSVGPAVWMEEMWNIIGNRPLREIVMPASHDAGLCRLSQRFPELYVDGIIKDLLAKIGVDMKDKIGVNECNTRTQEFSIAQQLNHGCRHFDIRPAIWQNNWYLVHGESQSFGYLGALGESLDDVLQSVRDFAENIRWSSSR